MINNIKTVFKLVLVLGLMLGLVLNILSCTVTGAILDGAIGTTSDDGDGLMQGTGSEVDKAIFKKNKNQEQLKLEKTACSETGTHQVCSAIKGCYCEKI